MVSPELYLICFNCQLFNLTTGSIEYTYLDCFKQKVLADKVNLRKAVVLLRCDVAIRTFCLKVVTVSNTSPLRPSLAGDLKEEVYLV